MLAITIVSMAVNRMSALILMGKLMYLGIVFADIGLYCYLGNEVNREVNECVDKFIVVQLN